MDRPLKGAGLSFKYLSIILSFFHAGGQQIDKEVWYIFKDKHIDIKSGSTQSKDYLNSPD